METKGRLIAGSHIRNEFILINANEIGRVTSVKELSGQVCRICGDEIEVTVDGEPFAACNECAFPVCRACYEYERREGNQACPQCKTRYKRIKGSPQVQGDEEEDEFDDFDNELEGGSKDPRHFSESALFSQLSTDSFLTYDQEDTGISSDKHALEVPPVPLIDSSTSFPARPMDPKKDLAVYGYGTVTWKDRMEEWKRRQNEKLQIVKHKGDGRNDFNFRIKMGARARPRGACSAPKSFS